MTARDAYFKGEWFYCGIVISAWIRDIQLHNHCASLWGIECNYPGTDNSYLNEIANDLLHEANIEAEKKLCELTARIAALPRKGAQS